MNSFERRDGFAPTAAISQETFRRLAEENDFRQENLEKVVRLGQVLHVVGAEESLSGKLALKGGTAINLMGERIRRLSVDLDFNYIGAVERERMIEEKPNVLASVAEIGRDLGYSSDAPRDEHGGTKLSFRYRNSLGAPDRIEIDVNWIMRVPLGPIQVLPLWQPKGIERLLVALVSDEELVVGKLRALIDRVAARDVFDACYLPDLLEGDWPPPRLRSLFVLITGTLANPLPSYGVDRLDRLSSAEFERKLVPVLNLRETPDRLELIERAKGVLRPMLELTEDQVEFVRRLQQGEYLPELLFPGEEAFVETLREHPALRWKAQNAKLHKRSRILGNS